MKTEELIARLVGDMSPVRPVPAPWSRAARWLACGLAYLAVAVSVAVARNARFVATADALNVVEQVALLATALTAAVAAFASVVPGFSRRFGFFTIVPAFVWLSTLAGGCLMDLHSRGTLGLAGQRDWPCVISMGIGGALLWGILAAMLSRGAPMTPGLTGLLAGIAALSIANIEACLTRAHAFSAVVLVWHGLTSATLMALCAGVGRHLWRWPVNPH
jgi:hypothetical protein